MTNVMHYVNIARGYLFQSACLITPDSRIVLVQFCFDVLVFVLLVLHCKILRFVDRASCNDSW